MQDDASTRVPLQLSRGCVVASVQIDLQEDVLRNFQKDLLEYVSSTSASGVIIDLAGVEIIDLSDWEALRRTMSMVSIMGARPVITGLRPGVASALVELGADAEGIETVHSLDEAFALFEELSEVEESLDDVESQVGDGKEPEVISESLIEKEHGSDSDSHRE